MNVTFKNSAIILSSLILAACGSSDESASQSDEHAHSLLISQINTDALSVLEEGEAEALDTYTNDTGTHLILSGNGEVAASLSESNGEVLFVVAHHEEEEASEEEHELPEVVSVTGLGSGVSKVINTNDHYSLLVNGGTQLMAYAAFEEDVPPAAEELSLGITEVYPALLLEEGDELISVAFNGTDAVVYEDTTATTDTKTCATVNSTAQNSEFALVSCDSTSFSVKLEEGVSDHTIEITDIADVSTPVEWLTRADVFVGLGGDDKFYVVEENDQEALVVLNGNVEGVKGFSAPANMCAWGIDSAAADIFALTASALTVYNHEGVVQETIEFDSTSTCDELTMATASQAVFVIDNASQTLYEIDKEAVSYHIHGREDVSVNDVASMVSFHELEAGDHDHSH